jgi:methionyl-tRNA formyltransferase
MKILILTTKTDHHLYFVNEIKKKFKDVYLILEKKKIKFSYKTNHKYFNQRSIFEKKFFFNNKFVKFSDYKSFKDINNVKSLSYIKKINPDIIILFGVGLLKQKFINLFKKKHIVNLHGGDPEKYRGLDSILWSLYHKDKSGLMTTLHYVDQKFDTGKIIFKKKINIDQNTSINSIRVFNTLNCVILFYRFLQYLQKKQRIPKLKQKKIGRYYSAIPSQLINIAIKNLDIIVKKIKTNIKN